MLSCNIGPELMANNILGGSLLQFEYHGPQNPILIIPPIEELLSWEFTWCTQHLTYTVEAYLR